MLAAVLLVWLVGLKILDQPRFSRTRGHAYAVRTLDTLYDVSTGARPGQAPTCAATGLQELACVTMCWRAAGHARLPAPWLRGPART